MFMKTLFFWRLHKSPIFLRSSVRRDCPSVMKAKYMAGCRAALLLRVPLISKYYRRPAIATPLPTQAPQGWKIHMRPRDHNILAREPRQQLIPRRRSRSLVDVENRGDLGMLPLDAQCMDDVAPKKDFVSL